MSALGEFLDGVFVRLRLRSLRIFWHVGFWGLALVIGIASGVAAVLFGMGIAWIQTWAYGTPDVNRLHSFAENLDWYWVVLIPTIGGVATGLIFHYLTDDGRVRSVADVIEGAALHDSRVEGKEGLASAAASLITLSTGGSTGREGPAVHIAAMISSKVCEWVNARGITARDLLGCATGAAVAASFNAPIAGALFALEVILRHYALHAFAPIVIASVAGAVVHQMAFGDKVEFNLPFAPDLQSYIELPAFMGLGLVSGVVAVILMRSIFLADTVASGIQDHLTLPRWLRPAVAGVLLGLIATQFPVIIGVGYETTFAALSGNLILSQAILFCMIKVVAVSITMGGRMGGGVFSPSLMVGALLGLSYGIIATSFVPSMSGSVSLYALAGMAAVAAAVLGAPISTTLIVFEMTGDWQTGLAVLVTVSLATALSSRYVDRSFFLTQLERRNIHIAIGPQGYLLELVRTDATMRPIDDAIQEDWDLVEQGHYVSAAGTLNTAMTVFQRTRAAYLPVVKVGGETAPSQIVGRLHEVDALRAYNKALSDAAEEEHS
jgi:CIC family chloride channel protein